MFGIFRKLLLLLVILILGGYGAAEVWAKGLAEEKIEEAAEERDPLARGSDASVSFPLLWGVMTRGTINRVEISNRHVELGPFVSDEVRAEFTGVHIDRARSIAARRPEVISIDRAEISFTVSQEEASKVLPQGFRFDFGDNAVALIGPGIQIPGRIESSGDSGLRFIPEQDALPRGVGAAWDFGDMPFVECAVEVSITPGLMRASCAVDDPPVEFISAR